MTPLYCQHGLKPSHRIISLEVCLMPVQNEFELFVTLLWHKSMVFFQKYSDQIKLQVKPACLIGKKFIITLWATWAHQRQPGLAGGLNEAHQSHAGVGNDISHGYLSSDCTTRCCLCMKSGGLSPQHLWGLEVYVMYYSFHEGVSCSVMSDPLHLWTAGPQPPSHGLPGKEHWGVGTHSLSPGIFQTQGLKRDLLGIAGTFYFYGICTIWASSSKVLSLKTCVASVIWRLCPLRTVGLHPLLSPASSWALAAHPQTTKGLFSNFLHNELGFLQPPVIKIYENIKGCLLSFGVQEGWEETLVYSSTHALLLLLPKSNWFVSPTVIQTNQNLSLYYLVFIWIMLSWDSHVLGGWGVIMYK